MMVETKIGYWKRKATRWCDPRCSSRRSGTWRSWSKREARYASWDGLCSQRSSIDWSYQARIEYFVSGEKITLAAEGEHAAVVKQLEGFYIDRFEYPNPDTFVIGEEYQPDVGFTQKQAQATCEKFGKRLCTAAEWEKACKGYENYVYSYGDD